jgi:hypothetical protein
MTMSEQINAALRTARRPGAVGSIYLARQQSQQLRAELCVVHNRGFDRFDDVPLYLDRDVSMVVYETPQGANMVLL